MRNDLIVIEVGHEVLLLGRFDVLRPGASELFCQPGRAQALLQRLASMPSAMARLRKYWADQQSPLAVINLSDHNVLRMVGAAIDDGRLQAIVTSPFSFTLPGGPAAGERALPQPSPGRGGVRGPGFPATATRSLGSPPPGATPMRSRPVSEWPLEERWRYVIENAVPDLIPALEELLEPKNLAILVAVTAVFVGVQFLPPVLIVEIILALLAIGLLGYAAFRIGYDLGRCVRLVANAESKKDLDDAAKLLAGVVVEIGATALMAALARVASRLIRRAPKEEESSGRDEARRREDDERRRREDENRRRRQEEEERHRREEEERKRKEEEDKKAELKKKIKEKAASANEDDRLEAKVAEHVGDDLKAFNKKIGPDGSIGEIDVETSDAIIEVTTRRSGKLSKSKSLSITRI